MSRYFCFSLYHIKSFDFENYVHGAFSSFENSLRYCIQFIKEKKIENSAVPIM